LRDFRVASTIDSDVFAPITNQFERVEAQTGRSRYRIFDEWLEFVVTNLARDDDTYTDLVTELEQTVGDGSTARECLEAYAGAFGLLVDAMADVTVPGTNTPTDLLGAIYEDYGATSDQFGQHFTPGPVATMKARLSFPDGDSVRDATPEDPLVIGDPACGSGRLPFHTVHQLRNVAPETPVVVVARDIDATCVRMATVNFALWGMPA
jgi:type I restriction-modification system DNA methylase subunit